MFDALRARLGRHVAPPRFLLFALVLLLGGLVTHGRSGDARLSLLVGFDLAALVFLGLVAPLLDDDTHRMRQTAEANDANRPALLGLTVLLSTVILIAVGTLVAGRAPGGWEGPALIVATLLLAWLFANTVFALHYAHLYYLPGRDGDRGGLDFPDPEPGYWDFLYFSFTLGMTFQTSDIAIRDRGLRKLVLVHCIAAFVFNMGVLAFTVNTLGGR
ncbi:DUF1345 domain-containing protein [Piscinibacter sakaiensis]|uniref:Putative transmembrane protein n=1 Tax=Piscinibacter sakaiensis TaxID=1547922 RepID=A0A0K8P2D3_PISS1|nr:DUF1345 domain-containing protein [Piscinibacter sakaiensis]GAP36778.1 putative transmembrane protein [Piscinibacter sakaiensis]